MFIESKIAEENADEFLPWDPSAELEELDLTEVRLGRGFLRADVREFFSGMTADWAPLFHSLGAEVKLREVSISLSFPVALSRLSTFEAEGELNVMGMDEETQAAIVGMVDRDTKGVKSNLVVEYFERRLLASMSRHWRGSGTLDCFYHLSEVVEEVEVVGAICCRLEINSRSAEIWFGVSPKVIDKLDVAWREHVLQRAAETRGEESMDDSMSRVSVELAELTVSPVMLIDYMRSGTTISLTAPVSPQVLVRVDGRPWARGEICRFNGRFAVRLSDFSPEDNKSQSGKTRVLVELASAELDFQSVLEHEQAGACLLLATPVRPNAALIISGENVATAVVGQIDDQFALNILPK